MSSTTEGPVEVTTRNDTTTASTAVTSGAVNVSTTVMAAVVEGVTTITAKVGLENLYKFSLAFYADNTHFPLLTVQIYICGTRTMCQLHTS